MIQEEVVRVEPHVGKPIMEEFTEEDSAKASLAEREAG